MNISITIIDFSPRAAGNCSSVAEFITSYYNKRTNVRSYKITAENYAPCHQCDYECLRKDNQCPIMTSYQTEVMDAICSSDIVYMIIPNFCGYPNANFFAFNERSVGYFHCDQKIMEQYMAVKKRFIIISNTISDNFRTAMKQQTFNEPEILYLKASKYGEQSISGNIMDSAEARRDVAAFLL